MLERYYQVTIIAWGFHLNSFMPSFFFFSNYLQNEKSFGNQNNKKIKKIQSPVDPINYRVITGPKHLTIQHTSKTYFLIDLSRIRPPTRLGEASNQK